MYSVHTYSCAPKLLLPEPGMHRQLQEFEVVRARFSGALARAQKFSVNDIHIGCGFIILALVTFCEAKNELIYLVSQDRR